MVQHVFDTWENLVQALGAGGHCFGGSQFLRKHCHAILGACKKSGSFQGFSNLTKLEQVPELKLNSQAAAGLQAGTNLQATTCFQHPI